MTPRLQQPVVKLKFTVTGWYHAYPKDYDSPEPVEMAQQDERSLNEGDWGLTDLFEGANEIESITIEAAE